MLLLSVVAVALLCHKIGEAAFLDFHLVNNLNEKVFVQILATQNYNPILLEPKSEKTSSALTPFSGRFWGRTDCFSAEQCDDLGPGPATTIDMASVGDTSFYSVTLEDGFNLPLSVEPINATSSGASQCTASSCRADLINACPKELQLKNKSGDGIIGCKSACQAFRTDQYCCRGSYGSAEACKSSSWPTDYPAIFKKSCPNADSYIFDQKKIVFSCNVTKYKITFG